MKKFCYILILLALVFASASPAFAKAKPKKKPSTPKVTIIQPSDVFSVNVSYKDGKKTKTKALACLDKTPGETKQTKAGLAFNSLASTIAQLKKSHKASDQKKLALYKKLLSSAKSKCIKPDFASMAPYTGPFSEEQARTLFDRFAFSASPERIQIAVQDGLAKTINKLTSYVAEPNLDAIEANMRCNGLLPGDARNGTPNYTCDPTDPNDIDIGGLKSAMLYRHYYTQNQFFDRLEFFIRDRFQSVNTRVIGGCSTWSVKPYVDMVRKAARTGDYVQYLREFGSDYFAGIIWLHLLDSSYVSPNEDEAREILQLGGTGPFNIDGSPVYGDLDVAQNALALTGWIDTDYRDSNDHRICVPAFSQQLHASGPETIFIGTPYQKQVSNLEDVVQAIKAHPRLAENIAENIYDDFINPDATPSGIKELAAIIRDDNYNLISVFKTVMGSKAIFADKSKKSIPKQPLEVLMGFLRISGMPVTYDYYWLRNVADDLGQLDLSPNTVFGWRNRDALAGEAFVLTRRNAIIDLLNQDTNDLNARGFNYWDRFVQGLPSDGTASTQLVLRLESWFNVHLNANQIATLVQFLDYDQNACNQYTHSQCPTPGQKYYLERNQFDPHSDDPDNGRTSSSDKTRGAIAMIVNLPEFMMK
jgi:hypothetical protein